MSSSDDWIKVRKALFTCPQIVRILSALNSDRLRVIGGLVFVWSLFDTHSEDGFLRGYTPAALDDLLQWSGFCRAMELVGWIEIHPDSLSVPRFGEHMGKSAKRRAEDTKRKRKSRPQNVRKMSATDADEKRTRERERDISITDVIDITPTALLAEVDPQVAKDWMVLRKQKKAPITATAVAGIRREASKAGISLGDALAFCCQRGWTGFKAEWVKQGENLVAWQQMQLEKHEERRRFAEAMTRKGSNGRGREPIDVTPAGMD